MKFKQEVIPETIEVFESYNAGAIKRIQVLQDVEKWYTAYETDTVRQVKETRAFAINIQLKVRNVIKTRVYKCSQNWRIRYS